MIDKMREVNCDGLGIRRERGVNAYVRRCEKLDLKVTWRGRSRSKIS